MRLALILLLVLILAAILPCSPFSPSAAAYENPEEYGMDHPCYVCYRYGYLCGRCASYEWWEGGVFPNLPDWWA